jgi:hypothetical protein
LWKFCKSYTDAQTVCEINSKGGNLAVFAAYKENNYCVWPVDKERPELFVFRPSLATRYIQDSKKKRKEHSAKFKENGELVDVTVYNYCEYAPFFRESGDVNRNAILLENFLKPIWFVNDQEKTQHPILINSQLEMLAFWLLVLEADLKEHFTLQSNESFLTVKVILDPRFKPEMRAHDIPPEQPLEKINIPVLINGSDITVTIPVDLIVWYAKPDNQGERHVIFHFLNTILECKNKNKAAKLRKIIDQRIPIGIAKMSSILGNANNIQLENRNLPAYRKVQSHDISEIQINLTRTYDVKLDKSHLQTKESRKKVCSDIATILHKNLIDELKKYDGMLLLPMLLNYHEACVQQRAIKLLDRPARIALFGADSIFILNEQIKENDRTKVALSIRCIVEQMVAHNMVEGTKEPNFDDNDRLIAIMSELIAWASLSDGIHLGMYDPEVKLLSCGRVDVDYLSINSAMSSFNFNRTQIELDQYDSNYVDLFKIPSLENADEKSPEVAEIENAFTEEYGINFLRLHDFLTDLVELVRSNNSSTISIDEEILFEKLKETKLKWSDAEIRAALDFFVLIQGWEIDKPPVGYRNKDTYPWHYNRALSFIRRPIAKLVKNDRIYYTWSYRHLYAAFENICSLIFEGIFWSPTNGPVSKLVKKYADRKGDDFRKRVYLWLKENSKLEIFEKEIEIRPGAKLNSSRPLGDIDVFAIDHIDKRIFCLECKNTSESKSVHDFKSDIDQYVKTGGKEYVRKHADRDSWLKTNQEMLKAYVENPEIYEIVSIIITAFDIPLSYMNISSLPILSFPRLKLEGIKVFETFMKR